MHELIIKKNDAGQRLDKFITKTLHLPTSLLHKSIRLKKIKVNRKRAEASQMLAEGDRVQCFLAEEFFEAAGIGTAAPDKGDGASSPSQKARSLAAIHPSLSVIYEDENILLLNKRPGVSVHEDEHESTNTLITQIQAYLYQKGEYDPDEEQSFAPALCNRIDRNTGGIVIAAKNAEALRVMNEKIKKREIDKFYLCAVHGVPAKESDTLHGYLIKNEMKKQVSVFDKNPPRGAKEILTRYRVIAKRQDSALLEVALLTGRTHQIRAHLSHIGHPLLGDGKYGVNREDKKRGYKYQALYSYKLKFCFKGEPTALDALNGKEFSIKKSDIYFTKDFFK